MSESTRIGMGYDIHRLVEGRKLILGGVEIPFEKGLLGHSDSDVLSHAICDALLGAAALGDIGTHFPDTDPRWAGASSLDFLARVVELLTDGGYRILNIDATVMAERPPLAPHRAAIRASLAGGLGVGEGAVNVKATSGEGMGFVGRQEGIAALAVATVEGAVV